MRVAIFTESYEPVVNGVSVSVRTLIDGLTARGHDVHVFAASFRGHVDLCENVYRFPALHSRFNPDYPFPSPYSRELKKVFADLKPDVVHTQTPYCLGLAGMRWAKQFGIPLVSTNHTFYLQYAHYVPVVPQSFTRFVLANHMRKYYSACSRVVVPSAATEQGLRSLGVRTPAVVIPTGVQAQNFRFPQLREKLRAELGIPGDSVVLLYVGRLALEKNIRMLMKSFAKLAGKVQNVHLAVVGGGPFEAEARKMASDLDLGRRVTFTGMMKHTELGPMYSIGDAFVFPSATDTQGIALIEAMVAGLPCVVVRAGGCPEMVEDGGSGLVCENDADSYACALEKLVVDADLRAKLARGAAIRGEGYTVEAMSAKMEKVYESVVSPCAAAGPSELAGHNQGQF
jgi:1,2-diacylglycerol 3-alpha-glucosyltransferase